jgi:hypothetical protein
MTMRTLLIALGGAALVTGVAACSTPNTGGPAAPSTVTVTASAAPTTTVPTATVGATTTVTVPSGASPAGIRPCELLTLPIAKKFAGEDAQRRLSYDSDPPVPVGDNACFYEGSSGSVEFSVGPIPSDPTAPVNHFHVINPENRDPSLPYDGYWFGPGVALVVVKNGQMLTFKVAPNPDTGNLTPETRAADVELANQIVPKVS